MMVKPKPADMRTMRARKTHPESTRRIGPQDLCSQIRELETSGKLLPGVDIEVEHIEATGQGRDQVVSIDFRERRQVIETKDKTTGILCGGSAGARFTYTFSARLSLRQNLRNFHVFYAKRAKAVGNLPKARGSHRIGSLEQVAYKGRAAY